jgi:hypothetical protein
LNVEIRMGAARTGVSGGTTNNKLVSVMPSDVTDEVLANKLPPAAPLPPSTLVQPPPDPDEPEPDPVVLAQDYIIRMHLHAEMIVADLNKLLLSEKGPRFRQAAAERKTPIGGDGRQWPPLNAMLAVILDMNPLGE